MPKIYERPDSPYFYAEIEAEGVRKRVSTGVPRNGKNRRKAEEAARKRESELGAIVARGDSVSLEYAAERFIASGGLKPSTCDYYEMRLERVTSEAPLLADVTLDWIKDYVSRRRLQGASDIVIRRELTALSSTMEYAIDQDMPGAPKVNPCKLFRKRSLKDYTKRPRWLLPEQVAKLMDAATPRFWRPFLSLILDTGMRHQEALGLNWSEVDLDRRIINLNWQREKTSRGRVIPMSDAVFEILSTIPRVPNCPYVFINRKTGDRYKSIQNSWGRLRKKAGVPTARIHDFRHTFASWARQSGMSKEDRKDIVGHVDDATHGGYAHASLASLVEAMRKHSPSRLLAQVRSAQEPRDFKTVDDLCAETGLSDRVVRYQLRHGVIAGEPIYGENRFQPIGVRQVL